MHLAPGTRLGPYQIAELIGTGGVGHVYRAHDTRLGRHVAVKVLSSRPPIERHELRRFQQEAQAASLLSHPNILAVYDFGVHEDTPYLVSELLEGETLRTRLLRGPLAVRKALQYAVHVAEGLAAAHRKGIVHRDIKPANLFVTEDDRIKILDFGLSKLIAQDILTTQSTLTPTDPNTLLGTIGYMSPEQITHADVDHRTDIFSFGMVLYEMLSRHRPFERPSMAETLNAVLRDEPAPLKTIRPDLPSAVDELVRDCLEKDPEQRFNPRMIWPAASPRLRGWPTTAPESRRAPAPGSRQADPLCRRSVGVRAGRDDGARGQGFFDTRDQPFYRRVTFARGAVFTARFAPDSQRVVYEAAWNGEPAQLFATVPGTPESRPIGLRAGVLAVSAAGQMAVSLNRQLTRGFVGTGTLAVAPLEGRGPRELFDHVQAADWGPDGKSLALVRNVGGRTRLEFPPGNVLYETAGWIGNPRVSARGDHIAFIDHPVLADDGGFVAVTDLRGARRRISPHWKSVDGLAWHPSGEVWFTAQADGTYAVRAVDLDGRARVVERPMGRVRRLTSIRMGGSFSPAMMCVSRRLSAQRVRRRNGISRGLTGLLPAISRAMASGCCSRKPARPRLLISACTCVVLMALFPFVSVRVPVSHCRREAIMCLR